tara:strand:- start:418 stop:627 length:210 start_codon:yes stop_codon:yes gene_type:complete
MEINEFKNQLDAMLGDKHINLKDNKYFNYLDELRDEGSINMFGASRYLMNKFDLDKHEARKILSDYMKQ